MDVEDRHQGAVMEKLGARRADLRSRAPGQEGRVCLDYLVPSRGLIGFRSEFLTATSGTGLMYSTFERYGPRAPGELGLRPNGVLVSMAGGKSLAYALYNLQDRGRLFIGPGTAVYEGMVVGIHSRGALRRQAGPRRGGQNALRGGGLDQSRGAPAQAEASAGQGLPQAVARGAKHWLAPGAAVVKGKQLTNIRAAGNDENVVLSPPVRVSLEYALEFIDDDELVEVTPKSIRIRKKHLHEHERKRAARAA